MCAGEHNGEHRLKEDSVKPVTDSMFSIHSQRTTTHHPDNIVRFEAAWQRLQRPLFSTLDSFEPQRWVVCEESAAQKKC